MPLGQIQLGYVDHDAGHPNDQEQEDDDHDERLSVFTARRLQPRTPHTKRGHSTRSEVDAVSVHPDPKPTPKMLKSQG